MGRFNRIPLFTGTLDDFCIYKRGGRYFFRRSSSLTAERVKTDPAFAKTRHYAGLLAKASGIGSTLYNALPVQYKKHTLYRKLTGEAMIWLKYGWTEEDVLSWMQERLTPKLPLYRRRKDPTDLLTSMGCTLLLPRQKEQPLTEEDEWEVFYKRRSRWLLRRLRKGDWSMLHLFDDMFDDEEPPKEREPDEGCYIPVRRKKR